MKYLAVLMLLLGIVCSISGSAIDVSESNVENESTTIAAVTESNVVTESSTLPLIVTEINEISTTETEASTSTSGAEYSGESEEVVTEQEPDVAHSSDDNDEAGTELEGLNKNDVYYLGTVKKVNWYKAYNMCKQRGMELASVKSQEEHNAIVNFIKSSKFRKSNFWVSATTHGNNNEFYWMQDGSMVGYSNFHRASSNSGPDDHQCIDINFSTNYKWNKRRCSFKLNYICQRHQNTTHAPVHHTEHGKYYLGIYAKLNWYNANRMCKSFGMDLVSIKSAAQHNALVKLIQDKDYDNSNWWTSGKQQYNVHYWVGSGDKFEFTNWSSAGDDESSEERHSNEEKCVQMMKSSDYLWGNVTCNSENYFICEQH